MVIAILFTTMTLENVADNRPIRSFICSGNLYQIDSFEERTISEADIKLLASTNQKQIELNYYTAPQRSQREFVSLKGTLQELNIGALSYVYEFTVVDLQVSEQSKFAYYLAKEFSVEKLSLGMTLTQELHVLEMDLAKKFMLVKFEPSSHLWACDIKEEDSDWIDFFNL